MPLSWRYASANQRAGYLAGAAFLIGGIVGLVGSAGLFGATSLGPFQVNGAQSLLYLGVAGVLVLGAVVGPGIARGGNGVAGSAAVVLGILGFGTFGSLGEMLAVSVADALLIAPLGLFLVSVASSPAVSRRKDGLVPPGTIDRHSTFPDEQVRKPELPVAVPLEEAGSEVPREEAGTLVALDASTAPELSELTKKELYDIARELDVAGRSKMCKQELVDAVASTQRSERRTAA